MYKSWAIQEYLLHLCPQNRSVAQLAEHVTLNHGVEGSSPSRPAEL